MVTDRIAPSGVWCALMTGKPDRPIEVAVIGGGCAAMAAAFELTRPEQRNRYRVTVYQLGWRLGGKGASGRGEGNRVEEHGLHLWMGFYENAFRLMRACYAEANRSPETCRISTWRDAFVPDNNVVAADRLPNGQWSPWTAQFPALPGLPGDPVDPVPRWTVADYMSRATVLVRTLLQSIRMRDQPAPSVPLNGNSGGGAAADVNEGISRALRLGELATFGAILEAVGLMEVALSAVPLYPEGPLLRFQELIANAVRRELESLIAKDNEIRRVWEVVDVVLAIVRGTIRFRLFTDPRGFDAIDEYDYREWLHLNGASKASVNSAFVRAALYDLAFAYDDGDVNRPRAAAGQALRSALRSFFTYRGGFFWKMQAGMGDVVFAPLWEVLKKRGVRFQFFHRLTRVRVADGLPGERPHVAGLDFDVQASLSGDEYLPLIDVDGLPCWPNQPIWAQLADGERLRDRGVDFECHWARTRVATKALSVGDDFDLVVLGVGIGVIPEVCADILEREPRWRAMVDNVKTVPTQALQLWLREDAETLGWPHGPVNLSGFVEPFDTWADMSHLIREERHSEGERVRTIAYFCSVLPEGSEEDIGRPSYPAERRAEVKRSAIQFLKRDIGHIWPGLMARESGFNWEALARAPGPSSAVASAHGEARFEGQYWRANVNPTDRYTLSLPGSLRYRISPLEHTFDNLTIAGDWTDCGFNHGCVEAAVMSGMLAAHAISELPTLAEIVGYDHP
jgi:uncharacterized protein with NAD-binding domain and iron-sulfur cluster